MDKISFYNIVIPYKNYKLVYNSLSNSMVCLTESEYDSIFHYLMKDLESFSDEYKKLYAHFKKCGFIVDGDFDEFEYIKLMNTKIVFENQKHHITINPTLDCNLNCWYCSTEYAKAVHHGFMSEETVDALKKHISFLINDKRIPALHLDWFGGEPLMYFTEVVEPIARYAFALASENNVLFTQHATTNSVLMTEEMIKRMADVHFTSYQITLDGNEHRHDIIKHNADKSGTFKKVINNINLLAEMIPNVSITLRINYDKKTLYGIEDVIPLITENARKHICIDFERVWQIELNDKDYEQLDRVKSIFEANNFCIYSAIYKPKKFFRCYADKFHHYVINYDGRVVKCTAQDYSDDKIIGVLQLDGQIKWNDKLLSKYFSYSTFDNEKCRKCKMLPVCMGPCIAKCKTAREKGWAMPCFMDNPQYSPEKFIISEAKKRNMLMGEE